MVHSQSTFNSLKAENTSSEMLCLEFDFIWFSESPSVPSYCVERTGRNRSPISLLVAYLLHLFSSERPVFGWNHCARRKKHRFWRSPWCCRRYCLVWMPWHDSYCVECIAIVEKAFLDAEERNDDLAIVVTHPNRYLRQLTCGLLTPKIHVY